VKLFNILDNHYSEICRIVSTKAMSWSKVRTIIYGLVLVDFGRTSLSTFGQSDGLLS
jgi:hypothetical protein